MRYATIVADPPWAYPEGHPAAQPTGYSQNSRRDGSKAVHGKTISKSLPYSPMDICDIAALPLDDLAAKDARVFLWTTNRWLPAAFRVLTSWGFSYRQTFVWQKAETAPFPASLAPNTAEYVLVGVRGAPRRTGTLPSTVFRIPAPRNHSQKPEAFLDMVEGVSPGPYLEMFSRRARLGWDTWGDEALHGTGLVA